MNTPAATPAPCYRIVRISDTRHAVWYDVEQISADGRRAIVATLDNLSEARDLARRLEADAARQTRSGAAEQLQAARQAAKPLQSVRRAVFVRLGLELWTAANTGGHGADRAAAAHAIRQARAALRNF